jgi:hypothetical protein
MDRQVVATAIGIDYGRFGWIAMMLVAPEHRGQGLGRRLLAAAAGVLPSDRPLRLDATPMGRRLYLRYGFYDEHSLTRYVRDVPMPLHVEDHDTGARPLRREDLRGVGEHDVGAFGGMRGSLLQWSFEQAPQYARIMQDGAGRPEYCLGRRGRLFDQIGPVVAASTTHACALVGSAMPAAGSRAIVVDAFDADRDFTGWLEDRGFRPARPLVRMCRAAAGPGPAPASLAISSSPKASEGRALMEFAILGPEFA